MDRKFEIVSKYKPSGDQPKAIEELVDGLNKGYDYTCEKIEIFI